MQLLVNKLENSTVPVKDKNNVEKLVERLGEGESEAIVLAQNLGATLLIRDSGLRIKNNLYIMFLELVYE